MHKIEFANSLDKTKQHTQIRLHLKQSDQAYFSFIIPSASFWCITAL